MLWHRIVGHHGKWGVDLQTGHDPAAGGIEFGPPAIVVIAQIEHVSGPRLDRHRLGDCNVVDIGGCHFGKAWATGIRIIDKVQLGPKHPGRELRPIGAQRTQPKAGGVDQISRLRDPAAKRALTAAHQFGQKAGKHRARPLRIGIRQRRARHFASAKVVELAGVALKASLDRPQAFAAGQLRVQQGNKLMLRRQPAHLLVCSEFIHKPIQYRPGHQLQNRMEYCIVMGHGVAPSRVLIVGKTSEHRRIHAMHHVHKN